MPETRALALLRFWFGFSTPVTRRAYLFSGLGLAVVKLAGDLALFLWLEDRLGTPAQFLSPLGSPRLSGSSESTFLALGLWSLPFIWIGVSMTYRRALHAGVTGWVTGLFFVPAVNYLLIGLLCVLPPRVVALEPREGVLEGMPARSAALLAGGLGACVGLLVFATAVGLSGSYGSALFLGSPFAIGFVSAAVYGVGRREAGGPSPHAVAQLAVLAAAGALLLFALEGIICLAMAYPIAAALAYVGSCLGALPTVRWRAVVVVALMAPLWAAMEPVAPAPLREVASSIEIDAPPETVWRHVTSFSELPPPAEWFFNAGIAYPVRARYEGVGEDAVRYCEFSTGAFVEPITRWEEPRRLSFDVAAQPPTMEEWSPYRDLEPAHLVDGLRAVRGEFRLVRRADGGTRLEGSTWYRLEMFPQLYWTLWSDALIHRIHRRVLRHVEALSEAGGETEDRAGGVASIALERELRHPHRLGRT